MPPAERPPPRGFSADEYAERRRRLQQKMAAAAVDIALFTTPAEFYYFCGFQTPFWQSPTRAWHLLLPAQGLPVAVIPSIGAALMRQCSIQELRVFQSPHPHDEGVTLLAETITAFSGRRPVLGLMRSRQSVLRMPPADFDRLRALLPDMRIKDISAAVQQTRMIKSAAEIDKIAAACDIAGNAFDEWQTWLQEGMPAREIFRRFKISCLQHGADDVAYLSGGIGAGGYADVISPPAGAALAAGDILMLDTGCTYDGYFCDFNRNIACRRAADDALRCHETLWQATEAGLRAAMPGVRCSQVYQAMRAVIADAGGGGESAAEVGRYGHGLGIELTETPSLAEWDDTELAAGMVITLEPSAAMDGSRMLVHEENIVIADGGARLLTRRAAPQLPVTAR